MRTFAIVVAMDDALGIGKGGDLAWRLSADLKHFKSLTVGSTVVMGRKTWDSLPLKSKPLPDRVNVVISRGDLVLPGGVLKASSLDHALELAQDGSIFVIGGAQIYKEAIKHPACEKIFATRVQGDFSCDVHFPSIPTDFMMTHSSEPLQEGQIAYRFVEYKRN